MAETIAVIGAGPGLGLAVARRFGREGFRVALVARSAQRLRAFAAELAAEGIEATAFPADITRSEGLADRIGQIDILEYAPAGPDWMSRQTDVRECGPGSFEFPLDLLLRTPAGLVRDVLPGMLARGRGAVLFGLGATGSTPYPQLANLAAVSAAARCYLQCLHASLAGTGVFAGLLQVNGMVGGSDSARAAAEKWGPEALPEPTDPADLAEAMWQLYRAGDRFETVVPR